MRFPTFAAALTLVLGAAACAAPGDAPPSDEAVYVTRLGQDTLVLERTSWDDSSVEADVLLRTPRVTRGVYRLVHGPGGELAEYSAAVYPGGAAEGEPMRTETLVREDGAAFLEITSGGETVRRELELVPGIVPFIDLVHWPFESALRWQMAGDGPGDEIPMFSGGRAMAFGLETLEDGGYGLRHPTRGTSRIEVGPGGELLSRDGLGTTRAVLVDRMDADQVDFPSLARSLADQGPVGELSGRGEIGGTVAGVTFGGDYGTPVKRGREIFGHLVAYGERWRTGANRATHISLDGEIVLDGSLVVPPGEYTLYTIPEEDGGTLIVNTRTGQTGTSYDEAMDLGRVPLRRDRLDETVEVFTIQVRETPEGGVLEFLWDDTRYWVPFTVD